MTRHEFQRLRQPDNSRHFVVIRDLRDTLVSAYFSMKHSHPLLAPETARLREALNRLSLDDGMRLLMDDWLVPAAKIQQSWVESDEPLIRYEDLLEGDVEVLERVLIDRCELPIDRDVFRQRVVENRFEALTRGRRRGTEDLLSHERKGIAGDWRNHLSEAVKRTFKIRYGGLLASAGHERGLDW